MPPNAMSVLIVSEQAEEIKLMTKILRSFYPGCRVEAVYSSEEALEWAAKQDWHIIIVDESLLEPHVFDTLRDVRRRAPRSAVIVAASREDTAAALQLMREGADYSWFKNTPAFLTELPIITREVLEKRMLRARLDLSHDRYFRLIDNLTDLAYELDADGRFVYMSPAVQPLLHYDPQELVGRHYSTLIPAEDRTLADRRFNERRSESRATRRFRLRLLDKDRSRTPLPVEINATALYDRQREFIGTVGIIRPTVGPEQIQALQRLADLPTPLNRILSNTEQLRQMIHDLRERVGLSAADDETLPHPAETPPTEAAVEPDLPAPSPGTSSSFQEQRCSTRIDIRMDTRATSDGTSWEGTALNMSLGGIFIVLKGTLSASEGQVVRLGFASEVGVLEVPGVVRHIRLGHPELAPVMRPVTGVAIQFSPLKDVEARILQSLLEGLRSRSISMTLTALFGQSTPELRGQEPVLHLLHDPTEPQREVHADRRQAPRVNIALRVHGEFCSSREPLPDDTSLMNLSIGGACLRLRFSANVLNQHVTLSFSHPAEAHRAGVLPEQTEYRLTGEVVWVRPDPAERSPIDHPVPAPLRLGLRFMHDPSREQNLALLVGRYLHAGRAQRPGEAAPSVATEFLDFAGEQSKRLALCHDHLRQDLPPAAPVVIVVPGYGRTKREYVELAYHFAANGCRVLRYDHSHHVGESDGGMVLTTLTGLQEDLGTIIAYASRQWPASPVVVVASDVAARVALKVAPVHVPVQMLMLLAPVLDLQYTLMRAHQEDLIAGCVAGAKRGISNILGFNIDADAWLRDAIEGRFADIRTTRDDLAQIRIPVLIFGSDEDVWMRPDALSELQHAVRDARLDWHAVPEAHHGIIDQPDRARVLFREMVRHGRANLYRLATDDVIAPPKEDYAHETRVEAERARLHHQMGKAASVEFWRDYLDRTHSLVNFSEYWHALDHIHRLLGPLNDHTRILDAGCGNGNFGMFLLITASFRRELFSDTKDRLHYVGVDLVPTGLEQAKTNLIRVAAELGGKFATTVRPQSVMKAGLLCGDLNAPLPFRDGQFDRAVCNLVLGYLRDPLVALRELVRVVSPGGKLVVATFKPQTDLTQIYRRFVSQAQDEQESRRARETVEVWETLTERSREGAFRSFDRQELAMLLISSGALQPRIYSTFGNQAFIAVAEKPPLAPQ